MDETIAWKEEVTLQDYLLPVVESLLFIGSVYLEKFVRKNLKMWSKRYKEHSRIMFVSLLTFILVLFNYEQKCSKQSISFTQCVYISFDWQSNLHMIVANTVLFAQHIYFLYQSNRLNLQQASLRKLVAAPILQQLLFRAVFYRSSRGKISIFYLSAIFAISHLHRHIRKVLKGKSRGAKNAISQTLFTFIFSLYTYYYLYFYKSIVPCILLHVYCNFLGPPIIRSKKQFIYHLICLVGFTCFMIYFRM